MFKNNHGDIEGVFTLAKFLTVSSILVVVYFATLISKDIVFFHFL